MEKYTDKQVSRRAFLKAATLLAGIAVVPVAMVSKEAVAKMGKDNLQYQNKPKEQQECSNCEHFVQGKSAKAKGTCNVVAGAVSPHGWCLAYAAMS